MSSGSRHSGSPSDRALKNSDSSKVYVVSPGGTTSGPGLHGPAHTRPSPGREHLIGWKKAENASLVEEPQRPRDLALRAVLGPDGQLQPGLGRGSFLEMMLSDSPSGEEGRGKLLSGRHAVLPASPRRSLYRTLSDDSLCSHRRSLSLVSSRTSLLDPAQAGDAAPYHSTLPPPTSLRPGQGRLKNELWFSDGSLAERAKMADGSLIPLPDAASGLDWSHLVDAARAFEGEANRRIHAVHVAGRGHSER